MSIREQASLSRRGRIRATLLDFLALTKPHTIHLVVVAIPAMLLAERGTVAPLLMFNTLAGAILMAAGANTLNCVADADIDKLMKRTAGRPLARAAISTRHAFVFGLALSVAGFLWLWWTTHSLAALLAAATMAFYVLVYTLLLKRRTKHNVVSLAPSALNALSDDEVEALGDIAAGDHGPDDRSERLKQLSLR